MLKKDALLSKMYSAGKGMAPYFSEESGGLFFIPFACFYDHNTIITKNGELLQVIKVENTLQSCSEQSGLKETLRQFFKQPKNCANCSVWIHTIVMDKKFSFDRESSPWFTKILQKNWLSEIERTVEHPNIKQECNLYITLLYHPKRLQAASLWDAFSFLNVTALKKKHKRLLATQKEALSNIASDLMETIQNFSPKLLGLQFIDGTVYSEISSFFVYLSQFLETPVKVEAGQLDTKVLPQKLEIGFNAFKVVDSKAHSRYGSIVGIKNYKNFPKESLDKLFSIKGRIIITEIIKFAESRGSTRAMRYYKQLYNELKFTNEHDLINSLRLKEIVGSEKESVPEMVCEVTVNITAIGDCMSSVNKLTKEITDALGELGLMTYRHDLRLENQYWLKLPGNLRLTLQKSGIKYAPINEVLNFVEPEGLSGPCRIQNQYWQGPISCFPVQGGNSLYYFQFHSTGHGHTVFVGARDSGTASLMNFLLAEASAVTRRIITLEDNNKSIIFLKAMNGDLHRIDDRKDFKTAAIGCLDVQRYNQEEIEMLRNLLADMAKNFEKSKEDLDALIDQFVIDILDIPEEERNLGLVEQLAPELAPMISDWYGDGKFANIFDYKEASPVNWNSFPIGINVAMILKKDKECSGVVIRYLISRIKLLLKTDEPTVIVIKGALKYLDLLFSSPDEVEEFIEYLNSHNTILLLSTGDLLPSTASDTLRSILSNIDTSVFTPSPALVSQRSEVGKIFSLNKKETEMLNQLSTHKRLFMVKQGGTSRILNFDLRDVNALRVLSAHKDSVIHMYNAISKHGSNPEDWLSHFLDME